MEDNCLFCKIIKGEIPSTKVYEDEYVYGFKDINPAAPIHKALNKIAEEQGCYDSGYRVIVNCGKDAGQEVMHLHYHLLAGAKMGDKIV